MIVVLLIVLALCVLVLLWRPTPAEPFRTIATVIIVLAMLLALFHNHLPAWPS